MTAVQAISCNASILKAILLGSRIVSSCHVINNQKQQSKVIGPCRGRFPLRLDMSPPFYFSKVFPIQNSRRVRFSQLAGHTFYAGQIKPRRFRFSLVIAASIGLPSGAPSHAAGNLKLCRSQSTASAGDGPSFMTHCRRDIRLRTQGEASRSTSTSRPVDRATNHWQFQPLRGRLILISGKSDIDHLMII